MDRQLDTDRIAAALRASPRGSSDYDLNPGPRPEARMLRPASVLVPLVAREGALNLVLTRRAVRLKHHPGQIAFPGGKQDPQDADARAAALREAREEIGLAAGDVAILGSYDTHETVTGFRITPFVGLVAPEFRAVIDRAEVAEVFEVPLGFVLDPANFQIHARRWQGDWRRYYVVPFGPYYIWGATARMLRILADRIAEPAAQAHLAERRTAS